MPESITYAILAVVFVALVAIAAGYGSIHWGRSGVSKDGPQERIVWQGCYNDAFQRTLDIVCALGWQLRTADPNRGAITAAVSPSAIPLLPLGAVVRFALTTQDGITSVLIEADPGVKIIGHTGSRIPVERFQQVWNRLPPSSP